MAPSVVLGLTIAVCYGSAFHVVFGRRLWQWPVFLGTSLAGFFAGYVLGVAFGVEWLRIGSIPLVAATAGSILLLAFAWYFSAPYAESPLHDDAMSLE